MERFDVVVIGAGPAGATAARAAAVGGARTLLVDRRSELGVPVQCGEFLPTPEELTDLFPVGDVLADAYRIPPETVEATIGAMVCVGPFGRRFRFPLDGFTVSRRAFDARLARDAERAGAELRHPLGVVAVRPGEVTTAAGERIAARAIVGADGPISVAARGTGFPAPPRMFRMITASAQGAPPGEISLYFGGEAPGGYAWAFPKREAANVGLGVPQLPKGSTLPGLLDRFARRAGLSEPTHRTTWWVPIGPPPKSAVRGSVLLAGDAAHLVMATNGGGIPTAMISGWDAGVACARHVREGRPLAEYDAAWRRHLAAPLARAHRIFRFSAPWSRWDPALAAGMGYIGGGGLDAMMRLRWPRRLGGAS